MNVSSLMLFYILIGIFLIGIFCLIFLMGLIKPDLVIWGGQKKTRSKVIKYYGLGILLFLFIFIIVGVYFNLIRREGFLSGSISFLFLFFILGLIIGLIKPKLVIRWGTEEKTRKEVLKYYGLGLLLYSFLYGIVRAYIKFFKEHGLLEALLNFSCLFFILGLIVGLIKPNLVIRWRERKTRGQVLKYYGIGLILSSFLDMLF